MRDFSAATRTVRLCLIVMGILGVYPAGEVRAHPLGNFSVNRWCSIEPSRATLLVAYAVDYAEIPTFQESGAMDVDRDGTIDEADADAWAASRAVEIARGLSLECAGQPRPLRPDRHALAFAAGAGGLRTMRLEALFEADCAAPDDALGMAVSLRDTNFEGRAGWRELVACAAEEVAIVDSTVPAEDRSLALTSYPSELIAAPPQVSAAHLRVIGGEQAARARRFGTALVRRGGRGSSLLRIASTQADVAGLGRGGIRSTADGFTRLFGVISARDGGDFADTGFGPWVLIAAFAGAMFWGAAHALSPGHGKTVVAAYLVGQRGTPLHAVWLGFIVTITHTIGVFALGALTLVLSRWFVPETIYPWLGFASGLTITAMGLTLLAGRMRRRALAATADAPHAENHAAHHSAHNLADHAALHAGGLTHRHHHGPGGHSHEIPESLSVRGLIALGVSGGIVPCPSALVVMLSAIAFHRILLGIALIVAFSAGLASVLVAVGLLMVYARSAFDRLDAKGTLAATLGIVSAATIALLGLALAARSLPAGLAAATAAIAFSPGAATAGALGLGFLFGLRHATEADHIAAVSAIVSERTGLGRALWTGSLWGAGHTVSILVAGFAVLGMRLTIPDAIARALEFGVALMIVGLGGAALARVLRHRPDVHVHRHDHGARAHSHLHFHKASGERGTRPPDHAGHTVARPGWKPFAVGMMHGLAGSAALTLLVLTQIRSTALGLLYLLVFGAGSIGGMALMSVAISLPFSATASRPGLNRLLRLAAGASSLAFGILYAWSQLRLGWPA